MSSDDQYMERTPDLVEKIRKMRAAADKEMNRFTRAADYDVRRVVGQLPKAPPVSDETVLPSLPEKRPKKSSPKPAHSQTAIEFSPAPVEPGEIGDTK